MKSVHESISEAASEFAVSRTHLSNLVDQGELTAERVVGHPGQPRMRVLHVDVAEALARTPEGLKVHTQCACSRSAFQNGQDAARRELNTELAEVRERSRLQLEAMRTQRDTAISDIEELHRQLAKIEEELVQAQAQAQAAPVEKVVPQPDRSASTSPVKTQPTAEGREAALAERERVYEEGLRQILGRKDREPLTAADRQEARDKRPAPRL